MMRGGPHRRKTCARSSCLYDRIRRDAAALIEAHPGQSHHTRQANVRATRRCLALRHRPFATSNMVSLYCYTDSRAYAKEHTTLGNHPGVLACVEAYVLHSSHLIYVVVKQRITLSCIPSPPPILLGNDCKASKAPPSAKRMHYTRKQWWRK